MTRILGVAAAVAAAAAVTAAPAPARVQMLPAYTVSGVETGVPQDGVSPFAGVASSRVGPAVWSANVPHDSLAACTQPDGQTCSHVRAGGSFSLSGLFVRLRGTFLDGGAIALVSGDPVGCTSATAVYRITGGVQLTTGGPATFGALLTHYQTPLFGACVPYFATVTGTFGP